MSEKTSSVFEIWKDFIFLAVSLEKSDHCVMIFFPFSFNFENICNNFIILDDAEETYVV